VIFEKLYKKSNVKQKTLSEILKKKRYQKFIEICETESRDYLGTKFTDFLVLLKEKNDIFIKISLINMVKRISADFQSVIILC